MPLRRLIPRERLQERVVELGARISRDYREGGDLHIVCVLKGAFVFAADLLRALDVPATLDFMAVASYGAGTSSSGEVRLIKDLDTAIEGRDVLIVEDIVDSGLTLQYLREILRARGPRSLRTACLLHRAGARPAGVPVEYIGFEIGDGFVVGYGLDLDGRFRQLPDVSVFEDGPDSAR